MFENSAKISFKIPRDLIRQSNRTFEWFPLCFWKRSLRVYVLKQLFFSRWIVALGIFTSPLRTSVNKSNYSPFFWHSLSLKLTLLHITPEHYTLDIFVVLGLKPDSSKNCQQINFLFLLARNYIWISKRRETSPKIAGFLQYLKSFYHIETTAGPILPKKWENVSSLFQ